MRKYLVPAFLAILAIAPAGGAAFAASATPAATSSATDQSITGEVKLFNTQARSLELADGTWFVLPMDFKAPDVKVGQKVTVHYRQNGSANDVVSIDIG